MNDEGEISLVRLVDVAPEHRALLTPDLFLAKESCRHCHGRGYTGFAEIAESQDGGETRKRVKGSQWCKCIMVNCTALADRMTRAREAWLVDHPEDLMSIGIMPVPKPDEATNVEHQP